MHSLMKVRKVTLIEGDGIGPEISNSVKRIFAAAEVKLLIVNEFSMLSW